jgi:hypothetical protein
VIQPDDHNREAGITVRLGPASLVRRPSRRALTYWNIMSPRSAIHGLTIEMMVVKIFVFFGVYILKQQSERRS